MLTALNQRSRLMQFVLLATLSAGIFVGVRASAVDAKDKKEGEVKKMMQLAHKGEKGLRDAPLEIVQDETKKDEPDWALLKKNIQPLAELGAAIKDDVSYTSNPGPYIAAVKALSVAVEKHNGKDARAAVQGLMESCAGCHRE